MSNIVELPRRTSATITKTTMPMKLSAPTPVNYKKSALTSVIGMVQFAVALLWPVLKWFLAIDATWQFIRMLCFWSAPGTYAGFTFLLHFSAFSALTYFVGVYRPRGEVGH